jgi:starvation-inducible DNA-binding protein
MKIAFNHLLQESTPTPANQPAMQTGIGLDDSVRLEVGQMLNLALADEYVLYATTRDYHWNVTGPEFAGLHRQFEEQCELIVQWLDDVAERARAIGVGARGNWDELTGSARSSADAGFGLSATRMLRNLLGLHERMIVQLRADSEACTGRLKETGTADFLTGLMSRHEKVAWMLRAQLESPAAARN